MVNLLIGWDNFDDELVNILGECEVIEGLTLRYDENPRILLANPGLLMIVPLWAFDRPPEQGDFWALK